MKKFFVIILFSLPFLSFSQDNSRFSNFQEGQVICSTSGRIHGGELYISNSVGDLNVIGIYSPSPMPKKHPVITEGIISALTDESIKKGDILTSGANGKVVKMTGSGLALGIATADASGGKVSMRICLTIIK